MELLLLGLLLIFGIHMVPAFEDVRAGLVRRMGEWGYRGFFSVISLAGMGLMILGYSRTPHYDLYVTPEGSIYLAYFLMFLALLVLVSVPLKGRIRKVLVDPLAYAIALWSFAHLLVNGDWASVLLFGSFFAYAILDILTDNERVPPKDFEVQPGHDLVALAGAILLYGLLVYLHPAFAGVYVYG